MNVRSQILPALLGAALTVFAAPASAQQPTKVAIAVSSASLPGGAARIAGEMGLYAKHGLNAKATVMDNSTISSSALISGSVDFTTSAGTEVVVAQARGQSEVAIMRLYSGFSGVVVLSKSVADRLSVSPQASVAERLKALDGLLIASPGPTSSYTLGLRLAADASGAKLRFTYTAMASMVAALESGAVQGFISSSPFYAQPVLRGTGVLWINGPKGELPPQYLPGSVMNLNVMRGFADSHPDLVARMTAVFTEFAEAVRERPYEVKAAIGRLFPDLDEKTLDLLFAIEAPAFKAEPMRPDIMQREIDFVRASGVRLPDIDTLKPAALVYP